MSRLRHTRQFLTRDIWRYGNDDVRGIKRWIMNAFKATYLSIRFFTAHRTMERASALTYYTSLAIVPTLALFFGLGRGFGLQDVLIYWINENMQGQEAIAEYMTTFAEAYLNRTKSGIIVGIGVVMLLYVVYSLISNVENVFNEIWQQKRGRSMLRKVTDYVSIIVLLPVFLAITTGCQLFLQTYIKTEIIHLDHELSKTLLQLLRWIPYLVTVMMLTFIYIVIPNCKVKFRNAIAAALIAGSGFMVFQWLYISGQIWVSKYNAVYGSFAALPLFLLWVQTAWIICLYGAELSYASQNINHYNFEDDTKHLSRRDRDFLMVMVAAHIYRLFSLHQETTTEQISEDLHLPARLTGELVSELAELHVIHQGVATDNRKSNNWKTDYESDKFSVATLLDLLSTHGTSCLKDNLAQAYADEWQTFLAMHQATLDQGRALLLRDIPTERFKPSDTHDV